jgi:Ca2+-binding EF-hand superfamily protein
MIVVLFAFDLYDNDSSGIIDADEVDKMLKEIYGKNFAKNIHAQRYDMTPLLLNFTKTHNLRSLCLESVKKLER